MIERISSLAKTYLAAAITSGALSVQVVDASLFPSQGQFRVVIDSEILIVTAVSGQTWTVTRGAEGTSPAAHTQGAVVTLLFTAGGFSQMETDRCVLDTTANLSAGLSGRLLMPSDDSSWRYDNGSTLSVWGPKLHKLKTPVLGNFSWTNQGSATVTAFNGGFTMSTTDTAGGTNAHILEKALPTAPYQITLGAIFGCMYSINNFGLCWRDSVGGKIVRAGYYPNNTTGVLTFFHGYYINTTTNDSLNFNNSCMCQSNGILWIRLTDDGVNRKSSYSSDGVNFMTIISESNTFYCTPDKIGIFVENQCITNPNQVILTVLHYEES